MNNRSRIAEPSGQDEKLAQGAQPGWRHKPWLPLAAVAIAVLVLAGWVMSGWAGGGHSFDASRLRIVEVKRGDLVRDLSADGRVI
ncbi:MAG: efflux transporter periplasmic adaptor subunit, partial [Thermomonas sp.]